MPSDDSEATGDTQAGTVVPDEGDQTPASTEPEASTSTEPATTTSTTTTTTTTTTLPPPPADAVEGAPDGIGGSREVPVPIGEVADLGEGWRLQVLEVIDNGTELVLAENQFNDPPPPQQRFTLIRVAVGYFGLADPASLFDPTISAVDSSGVQLEEDCGVTPDRLEVFREIFSGGVTSGTICFVTSETTTELQLYATVGFGGDDVFLDASTAPPAPIEPMAAITGPQPGADSTPPRLQPNPIGTPVELGEGWTLTITGPATDITDAVASENQFNDPPADGTRFVGIPIAARYDGEGSANGLDLTINAVGDSNVQYDTDCGVIPNDFDSFVDVFAGGEITGQVCFVVPEADLGTEFVYARAGFGGTYSPFGTQS